MDLSERQQQENGDNSNEEEQICGLLSRYYDVTYHKGLLQETNCREKIQVIQAQKYVCSVNPNNYTS